MKYSHKLRWSLAGVGVFVAVVFAFYAISVSRHAMRAVIPSVADNEAVRSAMESRGNLADAAFGLATAALGGFWAAVFIKRPLSTWSRPEILLFLTATGFLSFSVVFYFKYSNSVSVWLMDAAVATDGQKILPDIFSPRMAYRLQLQIGSLVSGLISMILTLVSAKLHPKAANSIEKS